MKFAFKVICLVTAVASTAVVSTDDGAHVRRKRNPAALPLLSLMQSGCGVGGQPPILNLLLYNYLLQNLGSPGGLGAGLLNPSVPLARSAQSPIVTSTIRTKVFTTVVTETSTTKLPIIFRGAPLLTTLTESFVKTVTATSFDTVPVTVYATATAQFPSLQATSPAVDGKVNAQPAGIVADALKLLQDRLEPSRPSATAPSSTAEPADETLVPGETRNLPSTFLRQHDDRSSLDPSADPDLFGSHQPSGSTKVERASGNLEEENVVLQGKPSTVVLSKSSVSPTTTWRPSFLSSTRTPSFFGPKKLNDVNHRRLLLSKRFGASATSSTATPAHSKLATSSSLSVASTISPTATSKTSVPTTTSTPEPVFKVSTTEKAEEPSSPPPTTPPTTSPTPPLPESPSKEVKISVSVSSSSSTSTSTSSKDRRKREVLNEIDGGEVRAQELVSSLVERYGWEAVENAVVQELEADIAGSLCPAPVTVTFTETKTVSVLYAA